MKQLKAKDIKVGDWLLNIGQCSETGLFDSGRLTRIKVNDPLMMSAAIFWYHSETIIFTDVNSVQKQPV